MRIRVMANQEIAQRLYRYETVHTALSGPEVFRDQHRADFRSQGFLAIENVFTLQEVQQAREGLRFLIVGGNPSFQEIQFEEGIPGPDLAPEQREPYVRKLLNFLAHDARLRAMAQKPDFVSL